MARRTVILALPPELRLDERGLLGVLCTSRFLRRQPLCHSRAAIGHFGRPMRVRHIVAQRKYIDSETQWSTKDMLPKHAPIYPKTKPMRAGWTWKSARCVTATQNFILVAECNPQRANWKAALLLETPAGFSVVGRFEDHGSHPGLHCHSDCNTSGLEVGTKSLDVGRIPSAKAFHRRSRHWTESSFWNAATAFFRVEYRIGPLGF